MISEIKITEGNLVMLKVSNVQSVIEVTSTCATIIPIHTPDDEVVNISFQRQSRCKGEHLDTAHPLMGNGRMQR